jgi:hypothetical protein
MQNKNNYTVKNLTDKIAEVSAARYPTDPSMKWAYTCGVLEAILDFEVKGYANGISTLQERINESYERYDQELQHELELASSRD